MRIMRLAATGAILVAAAHSRLIQPGDVVDFDEVVTPPQGYAEMDSPGLQAYKASQAPDGIAADSIVDVNAKKAVELIHASATVEALDALAAAETANPKHEGGRVSVLRAIEVRRHALVAPTE